MVMMDVEVYINCCDNAGTFNVYSIIDNVEQWLFLCYTQDAILDILLQGFRTLTHLISDNGKSTYQQHFFLIVFKLQRSLVLDDARFQLLELAVVKDQEGVVAEFEALFLEGHHDLVFKLLLFREYFAYLLS